MKRLILFSNPNLVIDKIKTYLFPEELKNKKMAYMPADGIFKQKYYEYWKELAISNNCEFIYINNVSLKPEEEIEKLNDCNILLVTGGKLTLCAQNLRKSGLDKALLNFLNKDQYVYAGYSAGAMILTPSIELAERGLFKEGLIDLNDLSGLNVLEYEILPHYDPDKDDTFLNEYRKTSKNEIKTLKDDEFILIDK